MVNFNDYNNNSRAAWCPGCSNFGILTAIKNALVKNNLEPHQVTFVSGIGQAAKLPHYLKCNLFNGLHGRALPVATGIKTVNPNLKVIVTTGDGDCYGEGGNHFLHTIRRNPDITLLVHNNEVYALTKGQASPTTEFGVKTRLQFDGVTEEPLNPLSLALILGCGFVARGYAGDLGHLSEIISQAINFHGFSLIDIIQPCITWGHHQSEYYKNKIYHLGDDYDNSDWNLALNKSKESGDKIPIGIFYKKEKPIFGGDKKVIELDENKIKKTLNSLINDFK